MIIPAKRNRPDLYYKVDGHRNASGHRFAANRVLEAIEKKPVWSINGELKILEH
jgi:hypothetical protein